MKSPAPRPTRVLRAFVFGVLALFLLCPAQLPAQTITGTENDWKSTAPLSGALWSTTGNWSLGSVPGSTNTAVFTSTSAASGTITLSGSSVVGIIWQSGAPSYTLSDNSGGQITLTLGADGLQNYSSNTQTITGSKVGLTLGTSTFFDVGSSGGLTISASGTTGVSLGANTLTLKGSSSGTGTISSLISGTGSIIKSGTGTWTLVSVNTYTGATTISGGVLSVGQIGNGGVPGNLGQSTNAAANLVFDGGTLQYTGATVSTDRNFTINTGKTATFDITTNTLTLSGASTATNGALTKIGAGTLILSGANAYTGATTINAGTLKEGAANVISDSSAVTVASGATYDLNSFSETIGSLAGGGTVTSGAAGALTLTAGGDNTSTLFSGVIQNGSGTLALTKSGTGILTLSGANTYTGGTNINAGTLSLGSSGALGSSGTISFGGGTLQYSASNTTDYSSRFSNAASQAYSIDTNGQNVTLASALTSVGGSFTKLGAGTLILSGVNTYTGGTTVSGGTLQMSAINRLLSTGALTVSGGTFDLQTFAQTVGAVSLTSGSITGTGILTGSSFDLQSGTISAIIAGTGTVTKSTSGTVTLSGANTYTGGATLNAGTLNINNASALGTGTFTIAGGTIDNTTGSAITVSTNNAQTWNGNFTFTGTQNLNLGAGAVSLGTTAGTSRTITTNANTLTVGGVISNGTTANSLIKAGTGTLVLTGANTFSGTTTINGGTLSLDNNNTTTPRLANTSNIIVNSGGTLLLSQSGGTPSIDRINNSATITLSGGTFAKGNFSEGSASAAGMGALTLTTSTSHIDFGTGTVGVLCFASFTPNAHTITIDNWTGTANTVGSSSTDRLIFDSDQSANLNDFVFTGYTGAIEFALGGGYYEVVAAPEPSTYFAGFLAFAVLAYNQRGRLTRFRISDRGLRRTGNFSTKLTESAE